jgi:translation initiation factor IF-2
MGDENGKPIKSAGPSIPVEILGLPEAPDAGDEFLVVDDERKAREVAEFRAAKLRQAAWIAAGHEAGKPVCHHGQEGSSLRQYRAEDRCARLAGSSYPVPAGASVTDEVKVAIVGSGVGAITESDVNLAESTGAVILGFNVRADNAARAKCQAG